MTEQTEKLGNLGINVHRMGSNGGAQDASILEQISRGEVVLVFCSPERFAHSMDVFVRLHEKGRLSFFAIDEVHCLVEWGDDFRPQYKRLAQLKSEFPNVPILAMSATLTDSLRKTVQTTLLGEGDRQFRLVAASMNRPNLMIEVRTKPQSHELIKFVKTRPGAGIIYCHTQEDCNTLGRTMEAAGVSSVVYHAGVGNRAHHQRLWVTNQRQWAIATVALGMGIDKADTRTVIHFGMPLSLERYMQEIGRAGRDGLSALCVLFWDSKDETALSFALKTDAAFESIRLVREYCLLKANPPNCRRRTLLAHFGEVFDAADCKEHCDLCTAKPQVLSSEYSWFFQLVLDCVSAHPGLFTLTKLRDAAVGVKLLDFGSPVNQALRTKDKAFVDRLLEEMISTGLLREQARKIGKPSGFGLFFKTLFVADANLSSSTSLLGKRSSEQLYR